MEFKNASTVLQYQEIQFFYLSVLHWCFALYNLILRIYCHKTNTTGVASGEGTAYPPESPGFIPVFSGVCVAQSLVFYVVFCRSLCVFFLWPMFLSVLCMAAFCHPF